MRIDVIKLYFVIAFSLSITLFSCSSADDDTVVEDDDDDDNVDDDSSDDDSDDDDSSESGWFDLADSQATIMGVRECGYLGSLIDVRGDINNDGVGDLLLAVPGNSPCEDQDDASNNHAGSKPVVEVAYVFYGPIVDTKDVNSADAVFSFSDYYDWGISISSAGDNDGDGNDDIVLANHIFNEVYFFNGPVSGAISDLGSDASFITDTINDGFGYAITNEGDLNNDNCSDTLIGSPYDSTNGDNSGSVHLFFGPHNGVQNTASDAISISSTIDDINFGWSVSSAGDYNNDGYEDLIIGAPAQQIVDTNNGSAYLFLGPILESAVFEDASAVYQGVSGDRFVGRTVSSVGDLNGDSFDDIAIVGSGDYSIYIFYGPTIGVVETSSSNVLFSAEHGGFEVLSSQEDIDNDNLNDLLLGKPRHSESNSTTGAAFTFNGTITGEITADNYYTRFLGVNESDLTGVAGGISRDISGDNVPDIILGAPYHDSSTEDEGILYIVSSQ